MPRLRLSPPHGDAYPPRADRPDPRLRGRHAEPALGRRFHLCLELAGRGLGGLHHRRLCPQDRRLARLDRDALNHAICQRAPSGADKLVHHSDRGSQYLSIRYNGRLAEVGIDTSVGRVGGSYVNTLAESILGLLKTEVIKFLGPWKSVGQVDWETLKRIDWCHNTHQPSAIGYITPHEAEAAF